MEFHHIYHNFFIHLSVNRHLGCFLILAIINSVAMNIGVHVFFSCICPVVGLLFQLCVFFSYDFSQGICPVVGLLAHMVVLFLVFKEISILFSIVVISVYIPTNCARRFLFFHTLSSIYLYGF